jgi:hypothetical protein
MGPFFQCCVNSLRIIVVGSSVVNDKSKNTIMDIRRTELSLNMAHEIIKQKLETAVLLLISYLLYTILIYSFR